MIPAPRGLVARYKQTVPDGYPPIHEAKAVIGFDDDGVPLVIDDRKSGGLVSASRWRNYIGVAEAPRPPIVAIMPADDWRVEWETDSEGEGWSSPLVGFGLRASGEVVGLTFTGDGFVDELEDGEAWRLYHPDASPSAPSSPPTTASAEPSTTEGDQ